MTMKACGAAYQQARAAGTLAGASWTEFRKAHCLGPAATAGASAAAKPVAAKPAAAALAADPGREVSPAPATDAVFPTAISPAHAGETPGKARRLTCLDQYRANKAAVGNGGLKWQQKGGGYYSACNRRLKTVGG
jgi:hypothetical protein